MVKRTEAIISVVKSRLIRPTEIDAMFLLRALRWINANATNESSVLITLTAKERMTVTSLNV